MNNNIYAYMNVIYVISIFARIIFFGCIHHFMWWHHIMHLDINTWHDKGFMYLKSLPQKMQHLKIKIWKNYKVITSTTWGLSCVHVASFWCHNGSFYNLIVNAIVNLYYSCQKKINMDLNLILLTWICIWCRWLLSIIHKIQRSMDLKIETHELSPKTTSFMYGSFSKWCNDWYYDC